MNRKRAVLAALVFLAALLLAILLLSLLSPPPPPRQTSPGLYQKSTIPGLLYEHTPGARGQIAGVQVQINTLGFRGREISAKKDRGTLRIIVVGDSVVFGQGVKENETLPAQLERLLRARAPEEGWEVINAGVRGYNMAEYLAFLEHRILPLQPDLIVLVITEINDPERRPFRPASAKIARLKNSFWAKFPPARPFLAAAYSQEVHRLFVQHVHDLYLPAGEDWKKFVENLTLFRERTREHGAALIALPFPLLAPENPFLPERGRLQQTLSRLGLPWTDPWPVLRSHPEKKLVVSKSDFHPSALALRAAAELLEDPILRELRNHGKIKH